MNQNKIAYSLFLLIGMSCQNSTTTNHTSGKSDTAFLKKDFYANGKLKSESYGVKDTLFSKNYDSNGKITEEVHLCVDTIKYGHAYPSLGISYHDNGSVKKRSEMSNNKKEGIEIFYDKNGEVLERNYYHSGHMVGDSYSYYSDGKIKEYNLYKFSGNVAYIREYDSLGNIKHEEGKPIAVRYESDTLSVNDTFNLYLLLGQLTKWKVDMSVTDFTDGKNKVKKITFDKFEKVDFGYVYLLRHICKDKGYNRWKVEGKIVDDKYNKTYDYSTEIRFLVK